MVKDLINSNEVESKETVLPNIEWDDYTIDDYCETKCVYFDKCSANRERCVKQKLNSMLKTMPEKYGVVLKLRWGFYKNKRFTTSEIAECLDLTTARVRQIESKALRMLKHPYRQKKFLGNYRLVADINSSEFYKELIDAIL